YPHVTSPTHNHCLVPYSTILRHLAQPSLFPYTTLFRSRGEPLLRERAAHLVEPGRDRVLARQPPDPGEGRDLGDVLRGEVAPARSEEHTSELQSHLNLVCRLLLEKTKKTALNRALVALQ